MTEIQLRSGSSSSTTHRLTQTSHAINRRNVNRPTNLAIEEAAQQHPVRRPTSDATNTPSRLVNLRVHAADLAKIAEQERAAATAASTPEPRTPNAIVPAVVEFGNTTASYTDTASAAPTVDATSSNSLVPPESPINLTALVPAESADEFDSYSPIATNEVTLATTNYQADQNYSQDSTTSDYSLVQYSATETSVATSTDNVDAQSLAMNIAADYATANFNASISTSDTPAEPVPAALSTNSNSIDTIAQAASQAIATIRTATDPEEVAEQVASLKTFADSIRATSAAPEMIELSDTIEKFIGVAMKSSKIQEEVERKVAAKQRKEVKAQTSSPKTTIKRPAAKRPTATARPLSRTATATPRPSTAKIKPLSRPLSKTSPRRATKIAKPKLVADEDQALRKALRSVDAIDDSSAPQTKARRPATVKKKTAKRFTLAFFCAVACVTAIVYFVGANMPDISVKVAAMQTGIEASYPAYIPRDYSLSDISSEEGKITLVFKGPDKATFTLSEEKSSWDSSTLLRNFVEPTWGDTYTTTHEQGITLYISGANAAWVNGGVMYKITTSGNSLTKKQLRNIVTSM